MEYDTGGGGSMVPVWYKIPEGRGVWYLYMLPNQTPPPPPNPIPFSPSFPQAHPQSARAAAPALAATCEKCWATCSKNRDCCYWMHCWSEARSLESWRAYNYPHVAAIYWSLYRLARHFSPPLANRAHWSW